MQPETRWQGGRGTSRLPVRGWHCPQGDGEVQQPWRLLSTSLEPGTALLQAPDRIQTAGFIPRSADPSIRASHRALGSPASPLVMLRPHWQGIKLLRVLHSLSGQGQLDGAPCSFSREEKLHCLKRAYQAGVRNSGMDSAVFVAVCRLCGLKAPVVHVTHLDRLKCDQISLPEEQQPQPLISNFIKQQLGFHDQMS
uniref:Uncharacterized protein n=1 Tax=Ailuropoda melanoleuca TaxID=9646 RepID=A0A7N5P0J2_AILME